MTDTATSDPTTNTTFRAAGPNDWDNVAALLTASALPLDGARDHLGQFLLAERDGTLVGCAAVERYGDAGLLRSVAVAATERGQGTGATLVQRCVIDASRSGLRTLVLLTTTADRYFPRFGFEVVGRDAVPEGLRASAEFQGACPASATVMRLSLPASDHTVIRRALPNDSAAIAAIYNAGIRARSATFETRERTPDELASRVTSSRHPVLVAERDGRVVGWVAASSYRERECYAGIAEFSVYVDPAEQGRRVGDALMRAFIPALEAEGFWKVLSRIFPENSASRALCRRHGFREVGVYEKHAKLDGVWRDVVIVERLLGEAAAS
jgi:L-amino acid N-acyltransferase YncA